MFTTISLLGPVVACFAFVGVAVAALVVGVGLLAAGCADTDVLVCSVAGAVDTGALIGAVCTGATIAGTTLFVTVGLPEVGCRIAGSLDCAVGNPVGPGALIGLACAGATAAVVGVESAAPAGAT